VWLPTAWQIKNFSATTAAVFSIYFFTYFLVWAVTTPLQHSLIPEITAYASLLFLPHGIRVLATSLVGAMAIPGMNLAELLGNYWFWGIDSVVPLVAVSIASGTVTWLVFEGLRNVRINGYYINVTSEPPPFHVFLLAGILASTANAFLVTAIMEGGMTVGHVTPILAAYVTGDTTGLLAIMIATKHVMPFVGQGADWQPISRVAHSPHFFCSDQGRVAATNE